MIRPEDAQFMQGDRIARMEVHHSQFHSGKIQGCGQYPCSDAIRLLYSDKVEGPRPVLVVSVLLTNRNGGVLLGKRRGNTGAGLFCTPGGKINFRESFFHAAQREFFEECGAMISVADMKLLCVRERFRFQDNHFVVVYIHAPAHEGEIFNREPDKCEGWQWHNTWMHRDYLNESNCTESADVLDLLLESYKATQGE